MSEQRGNVVTSYRMPMPTGTRQMPAAVRSHTRTMPAVRQSARRGEIPLSPVAYVILWTSFWAAVILAGVAIAVLLRLSQMKAEDLRINCQMIPGVQNWSTCAYPER